MSEGIESLFSERRTRKNLIDPELKRQGWLWKYIKEEVNSVKSDFEKPHFVLYDCKSEKGDRFIDYLLLDEDLSPLALVEVKRFCKDPEQGRIQARTYAKDIEKQIGKSIPIFLSNGETWYFIDQLGREEKISHPFSQDDLRRRASLFQHMRDPTEIKINNRIVDRIRSIEIVTQLAEHFSSGNRNALVHMATGTGKTRVAMALIDLMINANMVRHVLFLADRTALVNQAKAKGFQDFFTEPVVDIRDEVSKTGRLYVSTIQTMMSQSSDGKRTFEQFSPGFFDVIIFDEAHRSIYDKNNLINEYFHAIKIGLTATPREAESLTTYELFGCDDKDPTVEYSYDQAVTDGVLVPYTAEMIQTERLSLGINGKELSPQLKDQLRRQEQDPDETEFTGSDFDHVFMDDKTNELIIREFLGKCYRSDDGKPCKTIFFCASQKHAEHMKKMFNKISPNLSNDVQVIISDYYRAHDEIRRFQNESEPRIALSVGMLDTGVDIPEVCNLVFVKPVYSRIRFWQMIGRGTRNLESCHHPEWLPNREKHDFLIFDFEIGGHSNIHYHHFTESKKEVERKDPVTQIFENRVKLLRRTLSDEQKKIVTEKIFTSIDGLDADSFVVREKQSMLKKFDEHKSDLDEYVDDLLGSISPLMIYSEGMNVYVTSFILKVERLFHYILDSNNEKIDELRVYVQEMSANVLQRDTLTEVQAHREDLISVMQEEFWDDLTFHDVEFLVREIAPLMRFYEPNPRKVIQIDAPDMVVTRAKFEREIKEDEELEEFLETNPLIKKIKDGEGITSSELFELEKQLSSLNPSLTIEHVQRNHHVDFVSFLHEIIGISHEYDPKILIEREFDKHIIENQEYNSRQLAFLRLLKKVFAERKHVELKDLGERPFSEEHPLDYFPIEKLRWLIRECKKIKIK